MLERYDRNKLFNCDWYTEYKNRHLFGIKVRKMVEGLSPLYYDCEEISKEGFSDFGALLLEHEHAGDFLVDELMEIVHEGNKNCDLTTRYYAMKVLRYLQQKHLSQKIKAFMQLPTEKQKLETGAVMIAQWCQPTENIVENEIADQLDDIAEEVKNCLAEREPTHPLVLVTEITNQDIMENLWTCEQCQGVLEALNSVLFVKHKFCGNRMDYYNQNNSFIDKVLLWRTGIPISLAVIYSAVARRLGVICEPVNFPSHFLLRWKQHPMATPEQMYTYIDVFSEGKFLKYEELSKELNIPGSVIHLDAIQVNRPAQVFERMARNLVSIGRQQGRMGDSLLCLRNALELFLLICPDDLDTRLLQVRVNLHLNINLPDVIDSLETIADQDQNRMGLVAYLLNSAQSQMEQNKKKEKKEIKVKTRKSPKDAEFSVGLVMKHKRYNYTCVIYGWDPKCQASQEWIIQMGVDHLPKKHLQPFYNVLVEDGSNRYAAQENLTFSPEPKTVTHPEIGRYFTEFRRNHYVPNSEKLKEYPSDLQLTEKLVWENYQ